MPLKFRQLPQKATSCQRIPAWTGTEVTNTNVKSKSGFEMSFPERPFPSLLRPARRTERRGRHLVASSLQTRPDPAQLGRGPAAAEQDEPHRAASADARSPRQSQNPNTDFPNALDYRGEGNANRNKQPNALVSPPQQQVTGRFLPLLFRHLQLETAFAKSN